MSSVDITSDTSPNDPAATAKETRLEVVVIPVGGADRSERFHQAQSVGDSDPAHHHT